MYQMIHGSYGINNCPEAKGLVGNANFLFTKNLIGRLNAEELLDAISFNPLAATRLFLP